MENKTATIEERAYGPNCTEDEKNALRARVKLLGDNIISFKEVPIQSEFQIDLMFDEMKRLAKPLGTFYALVDLTETQRPPARIREHLRNRLVHLPGMKYVALFTGKNFILNMAAQFVFGVASLRSFSVHKTQEEAISAIRNSMKS